MATSYIKTEQIDLKKKQFGFESLMSFSCTCRTDFLSFAHNVCIGFPAEQR